MAKGLVERDNLAAIAGAIREKNGEETTYKPGEMAEAIRNLPSGGGGGEEPWMESAEAAYNYFRPKHWMKMIDMDWFRAQYPRQDEPTYVCYYIMLIRSKKRSISWDLLTTGMTNGRIAAYIYDGNTQKLFFSQTDIRYNTSFEFEIPDNLKNETDGYYEAIVCLRAYCNSTETGNGYEFTQYYPYSSTKCNSLIVDVNIYDDIPAGMLNKGYTSTSYTSNRLTFTYASFFKLRVSEPNYAIVGPSLSASNLIVSDSEALIASGNIQLGGAYGRVSISTSTDMSCYQYCQCWEVNNLSPDSIELDYQTLSFSNYSTSLVRKIKMNLPNTYPESFTLRVSNFPSNVDSFEIDFGNIKKIGFSGCTVGYTSNFTIPPRGFRQFMTAIMDKLDSGELTKNESLSNVITVSSTAGIEDIIERSTTLGYFTFSVKNDYQGG